MKKLDGKKLNRAEMGSISGGKTPAQCLEACYSSAQQRCSMVGYPVAMPDAYTACYYEYLASCSVGCAGWVY